MRFFKEGEQAQEFGEEFDSVYDDLSMGVNEGKKQLGCVVDFLEFEFDTLQMQSLITRRQA